MPQCKTEILAPAWKELEEITDYLIWKMARITAGMATTGAIACFVQPYGSAVAIPTIITAYISQCIGADAAYYNNPRGIIMDIPWCVIGYTMRKQ